MTTFLTNDSIDEVSRNACGDGRGGSDIVSFETGTTTVLSNENIFASLAAEFVACSHTWRGSLRIFSMDNVG